MQNITRDRMAIDSGSRNIIQVERDTSLLNQGINFWNDNSNEKSGYTAESLLAELSTPVLELA